MSAITPTDGRSRPQLREHGRALRAQTPRRVQADWRAAAGRDPLALLQAQDAVRVPELVPVRYGRMLPSPFTFFRGAAAVMADDLATTPTTGVTVQACGDAHMLNFGVFASPERRLVFDVDDFDETHPGPWEWDVKRLAASVVVAARDSGLRDDQAVDAAAASVRGYQQTLATLAELTPLEIFHNALAVEELRALAAQLGPKAERRVAALDQAARRRTSRRAFRKLVDQPEPGGPARIREQPPLIVRVPDEVCATLDTFIARYLETIPAHRAHVLSGYRVVDAARKVVGVGSVGLRAFVILLVAEADGDPLFLQVKEAVPSVIGAGAGAAPATNGSNGSGPAGAHPGPQGRRVVEGQQLMQAFGDPFLGWIDHPDGDFYVRQFRDMKASAEPEPRGSWYEGYARICGTTLARAHARSVDPALVSGYIGAGDRFANAIVRFSVAYADRSERDWEGFRKAVRAGRLPAERQA